MPKILYASCFQETNSFHPNPTMYGMAGVQYGRDLMTSGTGALDTFAKRPDIEVVPTYGIGMGAVGTVTQECFERFSKECLGEIEENSDGADGLFFSMHGAMAADVAKDPEGYLLRGCRQILGPDVPIVISLDMHGTVTRCMLQNMNGAAILHTYPLASTAH